jgi:hypothetical protein
LFVIKICFYRLQQNAAGNEKQSAKIVDGDVSSCDDDVDDDDRSGSEEQDDKKLSVVIVKSMCELFLLF